MVCDDFGGYKASFELGVTEIGMHGPCAAQVLRIACHQREPARRAGFALHPVALRNGERSPRPGTGFTAPNTARKTRTGVGVRPSHLPSSAKPGHGVHLNLSGHQS